MMTDLPYQVEYAKSGTAQCRGCEQDIAQGDLRIGIVVQAKRFDGKQAIWHHEECFFEKKCPQNISEIANFNKLTNSDQKKLKEKIGSSSAIVMPEEKGKKKGKGTKRSNEASKAGSNYLVEYAKSSGSTSEHSDSMICKDEIRVAKIMAGGESLPGFDTLKKEDQKIVKSEIKASSLDEVPVNKMKAEPKDEEEIKMEKENEKNIAKQNELYHNYRTAQSKIDSKKRKAILGAFLEANSQKIPAGVYEHLDRAADCITFGALKPCPECKGQLFVGYIFLQMFREKKIPLPPLKNLKFFIYGKLKTPREELRNKIFKMGGVITSKLTETLAAVVSTTKEIERMPAKMEEIKEADIEVVDENFFDLIDPKTGTIAETLRLIKDNNIADWGSDPAKRVPQDVVDGKSIAKSKSGPTKLKIKGGTAVDPESGLADEAHVYADAHGRKYTAVLGKTDVKAKKNSFYKLQVLESDVRKRYWLFRAWGRIGTPNTKLEDCSSRDDALDRFHKLYEEKTQNRFEHSHNFVKKPDRYFPVDVDYGEGADGDGERVLQVDDKSSLPLPVQNLVKQIFDVSYMNQTLLEFELDTEKMPLGNLSKKQIKAGYSVLSELLKQLEKSRPNDSLIIDATNRFYTLIPHNFGTDNPPLLNSTEAITTKIQLLDNLLAIEIAYSSMKSEPDDNTSPIEALYRKLNASITPLPRDSEEFEMILEYVKNTHVATHTIYTLDIAQVFKVVRDGEEKRFKPFKKLHNRRLLWHGSRCTNFVGILSQGLRIANMFGKGVYFADMVSHSANYCCATKNNPVGIMLLCEVALGDMVEYTSGHYVKALPSGKHSVWGVGRTQPDAARARALPDGTIVPLGPAHTRDIQSSLLYNEFIVYDVAQINVKYLLQMNFNWNY